MSAENSTLPCEFLGALSRSTITLIVRIIGIDGEVHFAGELFVRANRAERFSAEHVLLARDFDSASLPRAVTPAQTPPPAPTRSFQQCNSRRLPTPRALPHGLSSLLFVSDSKYCFEGRFRLVPGTHARHPVIARFYTGRTLESPILSFSSGNCRSSVYFPSCGSTSQSCKVLPFSCWHIFRRPRRKQPPEINATRRRKSRRVNRMGRKAGSNFIACSRILARAMADRLPTASARTWRNYFRNIGLISAS